MVHCNVILFCSSQYIVNSTLLYYSQQCVVNMLRIVFLMSDVYCMISFIAVYHYVCRDHILQC